MATLAPPSPAKQTTTTDEHREGELLMVFMLLTVNSGLVMYISWGDLVSVASAGVTYVAVALLLVRLFGCWVARQLDAIIWILFLSLGVLQVSRLLARIRPSSTSAPLLLAAAGATALGVGGWCAYMLRRRSCSKQQPHEVISELCICFG
ncbi:uncharacterized protein [Miscanthus floridulus]|uniref:uncharacterized protein n=1 Tax=Miscanthus floridulus TaxID=154761 RepID=UPI0034590FFE